MIDDLIHRARRCVCGNRPKVKWAQANEGVAVRVQCDECGRAGVQVEGAIRSATLSDDAIDNWNAATPIVKVR